MLSTHAHTASLYVHAAGHMGLRSWQVTVQWLKVNVRPVLKQLGVACRCRSSNCRVCAAPLQPIACAVVVNGLALCSSVTSCVRAGLDLQQQVQPLLPAYNYLCDVIQRGTAALFKVSR